MSRYFEEYTLNELIEGFGVFPKLKCLWGDFLHEGELGILFSDSGIGKTIMIWDIAISITTNVNHWQTTMSELESEVFILDLEQSVGQISQRFKGCDDIRTSRIHLKSLQPDSLGEITPDILVSEIYNMASRQAVIIVDNITILLGSGQSIRQSKALMANLKRIISEIGCTILLLAHTTKRNMSRPLTQNDLGGSKMLINFCDTAFALSLSAKDDSTRYLKQIKARNSKMLDQVAELEIVDDPYLHMDFVEWNDEDSHLGKRSLRKAFDKYDIEEIKSLSEEGYSCREIAKELAMSKSTVNRILNSI